MKFVEKSSYRTWKKASASVMLVDTDFMLLCLVSSLHVDSNVCLFQTVIFNLFLVAFVSCRFQGTLNSLIAAIYFAEQVNLYKYGLLS